MQALENDYGLDQSCKIELLKETDDETDTLFTASRDSDGKLKKDENAKSITVEKGILDTVENTQFKFRADTNLRIYAPLLKEYKKYDASSPSVELKEVIIPVRKSKK